MSLSAAPLTQTVGLAPIFQDLPFDARPAALPEASHHPDFRLIPLPPLRGWPVTLCEATVGTRFPSYATRREWRADLPAPYPAALVVFTDAANSTFVWTWRSRYPTGHSQYIEIDSRARLEILRNALDRLPDFGGAIDGVREIDPAVDRLLDQLFRLAPSAAWQQSADRFHLVLQRVEECDDPDWLRSIWRKLRGVSVLHPDCEDGKRLLKAAGTLEIVFMAVLERMRAFVADSALRGGRRRPEHLRDMRNLTEDAEDRRWNRDTRRFVRRLLVQQNLFAIAESRAAGRRVARDLLGFAGLEEGALPSIDCNVWRVRGGTGSSHRAHGGPGSVTARCAKAGRDAFIAVTDPPVSDGGDDSPLSAEMRVHLTAWEMVRRVRMAGGDPGDLRRAVSQLERRRHLLRRQLREMNDPSDGSARHDMRFCRPSGRPLSVVIE